MWYLVVSIPDLCIHTYFNNLGARITVITAFFKEICCIIYVIFNFKNGESVIREVVNAAIFNGRGGDKYK